MTASSGPPIGRFALVLHTHLPWVNHHGVWPVGEEWLHQAWATSYQPVLEVLHRLADEGARNLLTLGVTPIVADQWDDARLLGQHQAWLANWQTRAAGMAAAGRGRAAAASREYAAATDALRDFSSRWSAGGSTVVRPLVDAHAIELLGGPLTHTFTPLLPERLAQDALAAGLADTAMRIGRRPTGLWAPECAYAPGQEQVLARAGVTHLMLDGPTLLGAGATTSSAWRLGDSDVAVVGRDLEVTYRVWSPRKGYPGDRWYRDFHTFDHDWGFRTSRVTGHQVAPEAKAPYDPVRAAASVERDALDFVTVVRRRLIDLHEQGVESPLVVAAFDTELFGHWWHEGPRWLDRVLRLLPHAAIRTVTLQQATSDPIGRVDPEPGSWGLHKDWHIWTDPVDISHRQQVLAKELLNVIDASHPRVHRSAAHDQLVRETLLALSSDWAFMVSHDSAADYARRRFAEHADRAEALISLLGRGDDVQASEAAARSAIVDHPFGRLDARRFLRHA